MAPFGFLTSPRGRKVAVLVALALLVAAALAFAYVRQRANERAYAEHVARAVQLEKQGKYDEAIDELRVARSLVAPNDAASRERVEKKIDELRKKAASEGAVGGPDGASSDGPAPGSTTDSASVTTATASTVTADLPSDLSSLLPAAFGGIAGVVAKSRETASVRFDDAAASTSYYVYVYALASGEAAAAHAARVVEVGFPVNRADVPLGGAFAGGTGYYGENSQGDAMLAFSYGQLAYECLVRSSSLDAADKRARLSDLQKELRKP